MPEKHPCGYSEYPFLLVGVGMIDQSRVGGVTTFQTQGPGGLAKFPVPDFAHALCRLALGSQQPDAGLGTSQSKKPAQEPVQTINFRQKHGLD